VPLNPMLLAIEQAEMAAQADEVPIGAVLVDGESGKIIAAAHNLMCTRRDPIAHAEILVIQEGCRKSAQMRLAECDLYVTLEPCPMCAQAISFARIRRLYFGAYDPKGGGVDHGARIFDQPTCHHRPQVYGGMEEVRCRQLLKNYFAAKR